MPTRTHRSTRRRRRPPVRPTFHTGHLGRATPSRLRAVPATFRRRLVAQLLDVRDGRAYVDAYRPPVARLTPASVHARTAFAYQAGVKLGLKVTPTPYDPATSGRAHGPRTSALTFARHADPARREVLVQFVHTPKCGGRYFKKHLQSLAKPVPPERRGLFPRSYHVASAKHQCTFVFVNGHVPARNFSPYALRIGTVRNPFTRMQSIFGYLRNGGVDVGPDGRPQAHDDWDKAWRDRLRAYDSVGALLRDTRTAARLLSRTRGKEHCFPLTYWLCDDDQTPLIDLVLRQEHLTADVIALCDLMGLPAPAANQPRVNVTRHRTPSLTPDEQALVRAWWPHDEAVAEALSEETAHARRWAKGAKRVGKVVGALGVNASESVL